MVLKLYLRKLKYWKLSRLGEFQQAEHFQIWEDLKWAPKYEELHIPLPTWWSTKPILLFMWWPIWNRRIRLIQYLIWTHQNLPGEDLEEREEVVSIPQVFKQISDIPPSLEHGNHENESEINKHYLPTDCSYHLRLFAKARDSRHINKTKYNTSVLLRCESNIN